MDFLFYFFVFIVFSIIAYTIGSLLESEHDNSIMEREGYCLDMLVITTKPLERKEDVDFSELVFGSVVISLDYFKRFLVLMQSFFGGQLKEYESLLDRARREAFLRMKEYAYQKGFDVVCNMRFETTPLGRVDKQKHGIGCFEILAFGTAIRYK